MSTLTVQLNKRSYPIYIGKNVLTQSSYLKSGIQNHKRAVVVSNQTVAPLYLSTLEKTLAQIDCQVLPIILPDGEKFKNAEILATIYDQLLQAKCERSTPLIALGGGVIGDMAGFAAATYQRGMPLIQIPTSLLSQVDSSVGGKTAINHPLGKNMIGSFYQPKMVLIDTEVLRTLPPRQFYSGMAEIVKYGLIHDAEFCLWLEQNASRLLALEAESLAYAIEHSCRIKAQVVSDDEYEKGNRALLNFGHTFGHAIEAAMGYGTWLHGEAISVGMVMASALSKELGDLNGEEFHRISSLLTQFNLPILGPSLSAERYLSFMESDKKVTNHRKRLILLKRIGQSYITDEISDQQMISVIQHYSP